MRSWKAEGKSSRQRCGELTDGLLVGAWGKRGGDVAGCHVDRRGGGRGRRAGGGRSLAKPKKVTPLNSRGLRDPNVLRAIDPSVRGRVRALKVIPVSAVGAACVLKVIPTPRVGCAVIVLVPLPVPLVTGVAIILAESCVFVDVGFALAFGSNEVSWVPHCLRGGVAARLRHAAAREARGAAKEGAGAVSTAGGGAVRMKGAEREDRTAAAIGKCGKSEREA